MVIVSTGQNVMSLMQCFSWAAVPAGAKYAALCLMLSIGLNRLVAILAPFKYISHTIKIKLYRKFGNALNSAELHLNMRTGN
jgi:hypothetical protein